MKTPSDELFMLIKSLDGYEKRHFKSYSHEEHDSAAYLKLFEALDSMEHYDEAELRIRMQRKGGPENLKRIKSYLQESILRFLEKHYFDFSAEIQIQRLLQRIEVLMEKRLFDMAWKTIHRAERLATETGNYNYLLIILEWKRKAMRRQGDMDRIEEYLRGEFDAELGYIDIYRNQVEYHKLELQVDLILRQSFEGKDEQRLHAMKKLLKDPLLQNESRALSFRADTVYHVILATIYHSFPEDWEKSYFHSKKAIEPYEKDEKYQDENAGKYLALLSGLATTLVLMKRTDELRDLVKKAEAFLEARPAKLRAGNLMKLYANLQVNFISLLTEDLQIREALEQSARIREYLDQWEDTGMYLVYYANYAILHILQGDYRAALRCVNKVLAREKSNLRVDILCDIKIYNLLVHYELGNDELLTSLSKSVRRYLQKHNRLNSVDELLLNFYGKTILKATGRQEKKEAFQKLSRQVRQLIESSGSPFAEKQYDWLEEWLSHRIIPKMAQAN